MCPAWALPLILEAGWLTILWLFLPESRPWDRRSQQAGEPSRRLVWQVHQRLLLFGYTLYHLPGIFLARVLCLVDGNSVRPIGFLLLGAVTGLLYLLCSLCSRIGP